MTKKIKVLKKKVKKILKSSGFKKTMDLYKSDFYKQNNSALKDESYLDEHDARQYNPPVDYHPNFDTDYHPTVGWYSPKFNCENASQWTSLDEKKVSKEVLYMLRCYNKFSHDNRYKRDKPFLIFYKNKKEIFVKFN